MMDEIEGVAPGSGPPDTLALLPERDWLSVFGGLLLAVISFAGMVYAAYHGWLLRDLATDWAYAGIGFGFMFFALGAFVFAYGWERGDMQKALRLTLIGCVAALAAIVAVVLLMKSKGAAAKGAAEAAEAIGEASDDGGLSVAPLLNAVGSMLVDAGEEAAVAASRVAVEEKPFQVTCRVCSARFTPEPPRAECPYCKEPALAV